MKTWGKAAAVLALAMVLTLSLTACGGGSDSANYADGTYEGKSSVYEGDEEGNADGYGEVTITIKDNLIVACDFSTYETDGTLKDEEYGKAGGKIANKDYYNKAQKAVMGSAEYAKQLAEVGKLSEVDAISGATISFGQFQEAVEDALSKAKK